MTSCRASDHAFPRIDEAEKIHRSHQIQGLSDDSRCRQIPGSSSGSVRFSTGFKPSEVRRISRQVLQTFATLRFRMRERLNFTCSGCAIFFRQSASVGISGPRALRDGVRRHARHAAQSWRLAPLGAPLLSLKRSVMHSSKDWPIGQSLKEFSPRVAISVLPPSIKQLMHNVFCIPFKFGHANAGASTSPEACPSRLLPPSSHPT